MRWSNLHCAYLSDYMEVAHGMTRESKATVYCGLCKRITYMSSVVTVDAAIYVTDCADSPQVSPSIDVMELSSVLVARRGGDDVYQFTRRAAWWKKNVFQELTHLASLVRGCSFLRYIIVDAGVKR